MKKIRFKKKTIKKIWIGILIVLTISLAVAIEELLYVTSADLRFNRAMERGLYNGLEEVGSEADLRRSDGEKNFAFIDKEYEAVAGFKGAKFRNRKLSEDVEEYIDALAECREVIQTNDLKDYKKFWSRFSQPYGRRIQAIYNLYHGHYRLTFKEVKNNGALNSELDEILLQGWALSKTETIQFARKEKNDNNNILIATIKNDSGYDLDYLDITVELYDENNELIEETSAFSNGVKKEYIAELQCYETVPGKAKSFVVSSVSCERKTSRPQNKQESWPSRQFIYRNLEQ